MRFAVIGDFHFCNVPPGPTMGGAAIYDDRPRYRTITLREAPAFLDAVAAEKPDFVVGTGDVVEGGLRDEAASLGEGRACLREFARRQLTLLSAAGTHETPRVMAECVMPANAKAGVKRGPGYAFQYSRDDFHFLFLDYRAFAPGNPQRDWLLNRLAAIPDRDWLALVAHGPLYPVARPFFSEIEMVSFLKRSLRGRKADFFFCGHTHNQTLSTHPLPSPLLQVKCSSIGFAADGLLPLEREQSLLLDRGFHWGVAENSAPGFWIFERKGKRIEGSWRVPGAPPYAPVAAPKAAPRAAVCARFTKEHGKAAAMLQVPSAPPAPKTPFDLALLREARLNVFGWNVRGAEARILLNGKDLGSLPPNGAWAARRRFILTEEDLRRLSPRNTVEILPLDGGDWVLGGLCLVGHTLDGRERRSSLDRSIYVSGNRFTKVWGMPRGGVRLREGVRRRLVLSFDCPGHIAATSVAKG